jgi:hypothetical protein
VGEDTFLPHWLALAASRRARAQLRFGEPIAPAAHGSAGDLARAARDEVARLLADLR